MFLAGLKFALGFVVGLAFFLSVAVLALIGAAGFDRWLERRRQRYAPKAHMLQYVMPVREYAAFCFRFRTNDWISMHNKAEFRDEAL